jgi:Mlc titration factor MtfA (ptsG expression regulator)
LLRWFRGLRARPDPLIDPDRWRRVAAGLPWVAALDAERDTRLSALAARFLATKAITPVDDLHLDDDDRCALAAICCLPLLEFGAEGLHGWSELIVYPAAFRVERRHTDAGDVAGLDVVHEGEDELIGEAWDHGPLVLSWADIQADIADPTAGFCVAAHEMAHKLDVLDGAMDGTPPLPRAWQRTWARDFQRAYDAFVETVDADRGHAEEGMAIDPYAAESPEEFFAVCTEYHFGAPDLLRETFPEVAAHLARFYGPSPLG